MKIPKRLPILLCGIWLVASCAKTPEPKTVYAVLDTLTPEKVETSKALLHDLQKTVLPGDTVIVDVMNRYQTVNLISTNRETLSALEKLEKDLTERESTDHSLLAAGKRATFIAGRSKNLEVFIVSSGLRDEESISIFKIYVDELAKASSVKGVSMIGVSPSKLPKFSAAFTAIPDRVSFASTRNLTETLSARLSR